jgi:hypothetical protein
MTPILLNISTILLLAFSIIITTDGFIPVARISRSSELRTTTKNTSRRRRRFQLAEGTNEFYDDLKRRIAAETNPYSNIFAAALDHEISTVHVISFAPGTSRQGIHSIEFPKGSGNNVVLAFESRDACAKFAEHLKAQHFFDPTVCLCMELRTMITSTAWRLFCSQEFLTIYSHW